MSIDSARRWTAVIVLLSAAVMLADYARNRSLWLDEAFIALNVAERSYAALTAPLEYEQRAPLGFLWILRALTDLFGNSEYVLRLAPLLISLIGIVAFRSLILARCGAVAAVLATASFALLDPLLYYATEAKPYAFDGASTVLLLLAWTRYRARRDHRSAAWLAAAGMLLPWFSFPSLFVVAALAVIELATAGCARDRRRLVTTLALGATWIASFAAGWVLHLRHAIESPFMREFWQRFFAPSVLDVIWLKRRFAFKYFDYFSFTPWEYLSLGLAALGVIVLWQTQRTLLAVIMTTGLALVAASALKVYPIYERLLIFLAAPTAIMIGCGAGAAINAAAARRPALMALLLSGALAWPLMNGWARLSKPNEVQELKPVLAYLATHKQSADVIYVFHMARYAFKYYAARYGLNDRFEPPNYVDRALSPRLTAPDVRSIERDGFNRVQFGYVSFFTSQDPDEIARDLAPLLGYRRVWVVLAPAGGTGKVDQQIIAWFARHGARLRTIEKPGRFGGCAAYLYEMNGGD